MKQKILVALGASSGGLAVLADFFDHTLPDGVSYIVLMHLHPDHKSQLAGIMQKHSRLLINEVSSGMKF